MLYEQILTEYKVKNNFNFLKGLFGKRDCGESCCSYCGISVGAIGKLGEDGKLNNKRSPRGYRLEIERKEPNLEYTKDNCCLACYWCNNAKTDEFSVDEFKEIARGINKVWKKRGENVEDFKIINFDEIEFWKKVK